MITIVHYVTVNYCMMIKNGRSTKIDVKRKLTKIRKMTT